MDGLYKEVRANVYAADTLENKLKALAIDGVKLSPLQPCESAVEVLMGIRILMDLFEVPEEDRIKRPILCEDNITRNKMAFIATLEESAFQLHPFIVEFYHVIGDDVTTSLTEKQKELYQYVRKISGDKIKLDPRISLQYPVISGIVYQSIAKYNEEIGSSTPVFTKADREAVTHAILDNEQGGILGTEKIWDYTIDYYFDHGNKTELDKQEVLAITYDLHNGRYNSTIERYDPVSKSDAKTHWEARIKPSDPYFEN